MLDVQMIQTVDRTFKVQPLDHSSVIKHLIFHETIG
uniref:Uncharacterized protein n=1 Tax=Rhizophora mucronata TaxID=61149 RepID=A0A2P2NSI1_RHIMU